MIVAEYQFGNTAVLINDEYIARTPEEREKVDSQIATAAYACLEDGEGGGTFPHTGICVRQATV